IIVFAAILILLCYLVFGHDIFGLNVQKYIVHQGLKSMPFSNIEIVLILQVTKTDKIHLSRESIYLTRAHLIPFSFVTSMFSSIFPTFLLMRMPIYLSLNVSGLSAAIFFI
ncbi:hypothetical protein ACJX0J_032971, partial [Zea mays]